MHEELLVPPRAGAGDQPTGLPAFRWRSVVTGVPPVVWWITAFWALLLVCWSIVTPLYRLPDEPNHIDRVIGASQGDLAPRPGSRIVGWEVGNSYAQQAFRWPPVPHLRQDAKPRSVRPSYAQLGTREPPRRWLVPNQLTQHPPLYYAWEGAVFKALPSNLAYDQAANALRLASALLLLPLPLLLYAAARRLAGDGPAARTAAVLPLAIPQLAYMGAGVSNDNLMLALGGVLTLLLAHVLTGDTSTRTAVWLGVAVGLALLTKAFGFVAFPAVAAAYALTWVRARAVRRPVVVAGATALVTGAVVGGWWWVRNLVVYGAVQPSAGNVVFPTRSGLHVEWEQYYLQGFPSRMWTSLWGDFGWLERPLPAAVVWAGTAVLLLGVLLALRARRTPRYRWSWADVAVLGMPVFLLYWSLAVRVYAGYARTGQPGGNQGRYLFYGVAGMLVVAALGVTRVPPRPARWVPFGLLVAAAAMQVLGAWEVLGFYGLRGTGLRSQVASMLTWAPWPAGVFWVVLALCGLTGLATLRAATVNRPAAPRSL